MKMKTKIKQNNIEKHECTHFEKMKLCAFIFADFKNDIDCMMIESPLNDKIPEVIIIEPFVMLDERIFAP